MNLGKLRVSDLGVVEIDFQDDSVTAKAHVSVGPNGELAEFEEVFNEKDMPPRVRHAVALLGVAIADALKTSKRRTGPVPCTTCRGACCYAYDAVDLTDEDIHRIGTATKKPASSFAEMRKQPTISGFTATLKKTPRTISGELETGACIFLRSSGCSIYEHRPQICREYDAWTCGDTYEADDKKLAGKVRLRVLP